MPPKSLIIWATFVRNFAVKNFKKSPNLVTLDQADIHKGLNKSRSTKKP